MQGGQLARFRSVRLCNAANLRACCNKGLKNAKHTCSVGRTALAFGQEEHLALIKDSSRQASNTVRNTAGNQLLMLKEVRGKHPAGADGSQPGQGWMQMREGSFHSCRPAGRWLRLPWPPQGQPVASALDARVWPPCRRSCPPQLSPWGCWAGAAVVAVRIVASAGHACLCPPWVQSAREQAALQHQTARQALRWGISPGFQLSG